MYIYIYCKELIRIEYVGQYIHITSLQFVTYTIHALYCLYALYTVYYIIILCVDMFVSLYIELAAR